MHVSKLFLRDITTCHESFPLTGAPYLRFASVGSTFVAAARAAAGLWLIQRKCEMTQILTSIYYNSSTSLRSLRTASL